MVSTMTDKLLFGGDGGLVCGCDEDGEQGKVPSPLLLLLFFLGPVGPENSGAP